MSELIQNQTTRRAKLHQLMIEIERAVGKEKRELVNQNRDLLDHVTPLDLFHLPLYSDDSTWSIAEIKASAGRFVNLFYHGLHAYQYPIENYPILQALQTEGNHLLEMIEQMKPLITEVHQHKERLIRQLEELAICEQKYLRSEQVLFPLMERRAPSTKPMQVLWALHDELRQQRRQIIAMLSYDRFETSAFYILIGEYITSFVGLIQKEELILYPAMAAYLQPTDWMRIHERFLTFPLVFGGVPAPIIYEQNVQESSLGAIALSTGTLHIETLELVFQALPVNLTYVDEQNVVRFFNQTNHRHFPRTKEVIGRKVELCHPQASVHYVLEIIETLKSKQATKAQFWIDFKQRKLFIEYVPLFDSFGQYRGILEWSQDITEFMQLSGERRLAEWK